MGKAKEAAAAVKAAMPVRTTAESVGKMTPALAKLLDEAKAKRATSGFWRGIVENDQLAGTFGGCEWKESKKASWKPQLNIRVVTDTGPVTFSASEWVGKAFEAEYPKPRIGAPIVILYKGEGSRSGKGNAPKVYSIALGN